MIHTFEIQKQIDPKMVKSIRKRYSLHASATTKTGTTFYKTNDLKDKGIKELVIMKMPSRADIGYDFFVKIQINPNVILPPVNVQLQKEDISNYPTGINIFSDLFVFSLYDYIYDFLPELNAHRGKLKLADICSISDVDEKERLYNEWHKDNYNSFKLNRIDYTYDVYLCPQEYLMLLNRGYKLKSKKTKNLKYNHKYGEQNIDVKNNFVELKFYDKERQLIEVKMSPEIAQNHPVLRIELSLLKHKMYDIRTNMNKRVERTLFDFADVDIANEYVTKYINKITGDGDYVEYDTAVRIIENSLYGKNTKTKLKELILAISKHRGIDAYLESIKGNAKPTEATVKKHLKMIHDLGINPVTISKKGFENVPVIGGERSLPSLSKIVQAYSRSESAGVIDDTASYTDIDQWMKIMEGHVTEGDSCS